MSTYQDSGWTSIVDPGLGSYPNASLGAISCAAVSDCTAVGTTSVLGFLEPIIDTERAGVWEATAAPNDSGLNDAWLDGISCPTQGNCITVGGESNGHPLVDQETNGVWADATVPALFPPGSASSGLSGISCWAVDQCVGVGDYALSSHPTVGEIEPYVAILDGTTWSLVTSGLLPSGTSDGSLSAIACTGADRCTAVGSTGTVNGLYSTSYLAPLSETLNGATWTPASPRVAVPGTQAELQAVSCTTDTQCMAVGSESQAAGLDPEVNGTALTEALNGTGWTPSIGLEPLGATLARADGVSCTSAPICMAVGGTGSGSSSAGFISINHAPWPTGGYWEAGSDGGVFAIGTAPFLGSATPYAPVAPTVGLAATPDQRGYWLTGSDGGIFSFGDAAFYGSTGGMRLNQPIVSMAPTSDGKGYWLVASDGGVFAFGDASFYGSTGGMVLNKPIVGMAPTPDGKGYWLVASDGGVFSFGDASFHGSTGDLHLNQPVAGIAATPTGGGYWLVASDGGVFSFGDAIFAGSLGGSTGHAPVVAISGAADGHGYLMTEADGTVTAFGSATYQGDASGLGVGESIVGLAP